MCMCVTVSVRLCVYARVYDCVWVCVIVHECVCVCLYVYVVCVEGVTCGFG